MQEAFAGLAREIEDITNGKVTDIFQIQMLFGNFMIKYFKLILQRKYFLSEMEKQIWVTYFIGIWMKNRIPKLFYSTLSKNTDQAEQSLQKQDLVHAELGIVKELEIIELIFNNDNDFYNFRVSKNNPEVEDRLSRIYDTMERLDKPISKSQESDINNFGEVKNEMINTSSFFTNDQQHQQIGSTRFEVAIVKRPALTSFYYVHNINVFAKYNGFQFLLGIIQGQVQKQQLMGISMVKVCMSILSLMSQMKSYFIDSFWSIGEQYGTKIAHSCYDFVVLRCTQEDLRTAQKKDLLYLANNIESILDSVTNGFTNDEKVDLVYRVSESLELELALKCLKSPVLEKKLIGHQLLMSAIYKIRVNSKQSLRQGSLNLQNLVAKRWLTNDLMLEWLENHKIFDLVFGDSLHSEVIKKSYILLDYLYQNGKIERREFDKMWECATKKHEAYKVAILKALAFLASKSKIEDLKYLFLKLKSIPLSEVDKFCLDLIKAIAKKLAGDDSIVVGSPKRHPLHSALRNQAAMGPTLPPSFNKLPRSNSGDRINKQVLFEDSEMLDGGANWKTDDKLNNSFSNGTRRRDNQEESKFTLDNVMFHKKGINKMKRNNSSPRANEKDLLEQFDPKSLIDEIDKRKREKMAQSPPHQITINPPQNEMDMLINQDLNPLEVPADKEDKKTADDDQSFGDNNQMIDGIRMNDIFNTSMRDDQMPSTDQQVKKNQYDLEEEKEGGDPFSDGNHAAMIQNLNELLQDQSLGIEDLNKRDLAQQVLDYLWLLCQESSVSRHDLSLQAHKQSIEDLTHLIIFNYARSTISFIGRCIGSLQVHQSVMSMHVILQKLIMNVSYPLVKDKILPNNRQELISVLDQELNFTNVCLSSYIEFKRFSLNYIFDQMGSQEHEQENLETQSSLDNDEERSNSTAGIIPAGGQQQQNRQIQGNNQQLIGIQALTPSNNPEGAQNKDHIHIHEDQITAQSSSSFFVSPRMKVEEEFKIPKQIRTQSFRDDGMQSIQKTNSVGFEAIITPKEVDIINQDQLIQVNPNQIQQTLSGGFITQNRQFNSQSKRANGVMTNNNRGDAGLQTNLAQNQFRQESMEPPVQGQITQQQQQQQPQPGPSTNVNRDFLNSLITNEVYKYTYQDELHLRLDFLKFLVGSSPQILKPQQLQILWECLVINAFYEKERDQFFNWCTQILKTSQQIPNQRKNGLLQNEVASESIFNDDCLEMLYFDTLLKLDFRYITEVMYECFERYFIYINEQYGQIVTSSTFESAFEVFETKLIGVEALWEILLSARNNKVYKLATEFLHKIYKKMSPTLVERLNEIKEELLQTCMEYIKTGYNEIRAEAGGQENLYEVPIYQLSHSIEDPKNRIARSISQLCKFIDEFEGLRDKSAKSQLGAADREISVLGNNQIGSNPQPKKISLQRPITTKIGQIREEFANAIHPKRQSKEISMFYKGRDLNEDLKTLKDLGIGQNDTQIQIFISLRNQYELDMEMGKADMAQNNQLVNETIDQIKSFMGDVDIPEAVLKLAIQKCNFNIDEIVMMIIDPDKINDLQDEVRKTEEANANNNIVMIEEAKEDNPNEEPKLNIIISNRSEYFDLLFELLNLGINEITNAAWNLLIQIPVNKNLLHQIRTLSTIQQGHQNNWCQIIDPSNSYKMLYSIQIVNSLISVNNEKLSESEIQERYEWRLRFLELGGFEHLYSILITAEPDEFLGTNQQNQRIAPGQSKKKSKGQSQQQKRINEVQQPNSDNKENMQIQNNQAKCLGYLISIIKIFIQAALLTADEDKLLTLIVQSSTSPFRKPKSMKSVLQSVPQSKFNQIMFGAGHNQSNAVNSGQIESSPEENSRDTSSINTPKFQSSHSSTPQCQTPNPNENAADKGPQSPLNKSQETVKADTFFQQSVQGGNQGNENQLYTQVDDFPRLVEQISGPIASNLLDKVVNFNGLISKLLNIIYKAVMFCDSQEVSSLVQNSLDLLLPCIVWRPQQLLKEIYDFDYLESLLIRTLMHNSNENVRRSIERTFKIICNENFESKNSLQQEREVIVPPRVYILRILLKNLPNIEEKSDYCEEYFNLITHLMKQSQQSFKIQELLSNEMNDVSMIETEQSSTFKQKLILEDGTFSPLSLLQWCIYQLKMRPCYEDKYNQYTDKILAGYLQLTQSVLEICPNLKKLTTSKSGGYNLIKVIFDFLFLLPSVETEQSKHKNPQALIMLSGQDSHPKCKRKLTRKKAFNLLLTLCYQQEDNFVQLLQELYIFHSQIQKSQEVVNFADFDNEVGMRSASGYVGLKNFGCTCYMNALMQQLFMIPDLRQGILDSEVNDPDLSQNVLYQLKLIFANLQESEKQYYAPVGFTKAFNFYGEPVNVRQQQDTYEFFNMLCDNLENLLKGSPLANLLKDTVGGLIGNETRSMEEEYQYVGEREEPFFAISLDIKNKKNLAEALDLYIKPDHLEGDNKYFCEKHNRKIDAQRRSYLKSLSNTVIINLKRFEFDYNSMQRFKVNDYCEFPERINFKPWTREGIRERERMNRRKQRQENKVGGGDVVSEELGSFDEEEEAIMEEAPIDEGIDSNEEVAVAPQSEEDMDEDNMNSMMNTGKYFDVGVMEDFIDIAADDEEDVKKAQRAEQKRSADQEKKSIMKEEEKKLGEKIKAPKKRGGQDKDDSYYEYELVGVLVHSGSADAGHYYSFIKERKQNIMAPGQNQNRWLEFNDTYVREFDAKNLGIECFGGEQDRNGRQGGVSASRGLLDDFSPADARLFERCRNAYLLFYERVEPIVQPKQVPISLPLQSKKSVNGVESSVYQRIWDENAAFMKLKIFFDQEYFSFARDYVNLYNFENVLFFGPEHSSNFKYSSFIAQTETFLQQSFNQGNDITQEQKINLQSQQQETERLSKQSEDSDIFSPGVNSQISLKEKISSDPGLHTIKLATILSQDIITKVKDVQSFVQWMQLMDSLYERHAVACVWLIKYLTENRKLMEELLIENSYFEVRESFAKLLMTAISVTAKNEEPYMLKTDDILYVQGDKNQDLLIERQAVSKSAVIRFMEIFFNDNILDKVLRLNWRKFDEYFQVLASFAQIGFAQTKYLIVQQNAILRLLEFVMNSTSPFTSSKPKMGDRMQEANFTQAIDILSILVRSCFTQGIKRVSQYSPESKYQEENQHIELQTSYGQLDQFPFLTSDCFTNDLLIKANPNNDSLQRMVVHLCWGDPETSSFFIEEIMNAIRNRRSTEDLQYHLNILSSLMRLTDEFQNFRLKQIFKFEFSAVNTFSGEIISQNQQRSLYRHFEQLRYSSQNYVLKMLQFFGHQAVFLDSSHTLMNFLKENSPVINCQLSYYSITKIGYSPICSI